MRVGMAFVLTALVAMPERHVLAWWQNAMPNHLRDQRVFTVVEFDGRPEMGFGLGTYYRDSGPHVLLDGFWEWLTK